MSPKDRNHDNRVRHVARMIEITHLKPHQRQRPLRWIIKLTESLQNKRGAGVGYGVWGMGYGDDLRPERMIRPTPERLGGGMTGRLIIGVSV